MDNESKISSKTPSRQGLYAQVAIHVPKAIEVLVACLDSRNEGIRMGAAKEIIAKALPDIKAMEIGGQDGEPLRISIIAGNGFIPPGYTFNAPSAGSTLPKSTTLQSADLAQESKKDNNSNNGDSKAVTD